jgi:hypothetical protein
MGLRGVSSPLLWSAAVARQKRVNGLGIGYLSVAIGVDRHDGGFRSFCYGLPLYSRQYGSVAIQHLYQEFRLLSCGSAVRIRPGRPIVLKNLRPRWSVRARFGASITRQHRRPSSELVVPRDEARGAEPVLRLHGEEHVRTAGGSSRRTYADAWIDSRVVYRKVVTR